MLACCAIAATIAVVVLGRWLAGSMTNPHVLPMAPDTAGAVLLLATALAARERGPGAWIARRIPAVLAAIVAVIAVLVMLHPFGVFSPEWEARLARTQATVDGIPVGRMSVLSAVVLLVLSGSMLVSSFPRPPHPAVRWSFAVGTACAAGFSGLIASAYVAGVPLFYRPGFVPVAWSTAVALFAVSVAAFVAVSDRESMGRLLRSIRGRLFASFGTIVGLMAFLFAMAYLGLTGMRNATDTLGEEDSALFISLFLGAGIVSVVGTVALARYLDRTLRAYQRERDRAGAYNRSLIEASLDPLVTIGRDGRITDVNAAAETATGRCRAEMIGTDFSDYFTQPEEARAVCQQVFREGAVRDYPLELRHRGTSVLYNASVYRDERGQVAGVLAAARDITERKRAENALLESEAKFRSLFESMMAGVIIQDAAGKITHANPAACAILGLQMDQLMGRTPYDQRWRLIKEDGTSFQPGEMPSEIALHTGRSVSNFLTGIFVPEKEEHRWILINSVPMLDEQKSPFATITTFLDITERKRAEVVLEESERSFRALAECMPQIVWATRADGWNVYFNQHWVRYTGLTLEESYGHGWNIPFHPDDRQRAWEAWQEATQHGATYALEVRLRRADGVYRWWLVRGVPLLDANGKVTKWFGTCTDIHDLKQAEMEIRQLNTSLEQRVADRTRELTRWMTKLRTIFETAPVGLAVAEDAEGRNIRGNPTIERLTGVARENELSLSAATPAAYRALDAEGHDVPPSQLPMQRACRGEVVSGWTMQIVRPDGQVSILHSNATPLRDENGRLSGAVGAFMDVTALKHAEAELARMSALLAEGQKIAHLGSFEYDNATRATVWSEEEFRIYGLDPAGASPSYDDLLARHIFPEDAPLLHQTFTTAIQQGAVYELEHRIVRPDGSVRWVHDRAQPYFDANGAIVRYAGTTLDVTERKRDEQALRENEHRLALATHAAQEGIWDWDITSGRLDWTPEVFRMFGLDPARTPASFEAWRQAMHPADREQAEAHVQDALRNRTRLENEFRVQLPSGETRWIAALGDTTYAEDGTPRRMTGVCFDITARKQADLELQKLTAELKVTNAELESFAYSVSHDLRAPLRGIDGFSRILLRDSAAALGETGRENLERIRIATQRMGHLIDDLLQLSRTARAEFNRKQVDLAHVARAIAADLDATDPGRHVAWRIAPELPAMADPTLIRAVLENLLGNAWKFTARRDAAQIEFDAVERDGERVFRVRDNGAGFDMRYVDKLFGAFQRLHPTEEFPGTGIGLATVQRIVRRHGGRVWAEGAVDAGAQFYFTLPEPAATPPS